MFLLPSPGIPVGGLFRTRRPRASRQLPSASSMLLESVEPTGGAAASSTGAPNVDRSELNRPSGSESEAEGEPEADYSVGDEGDEGKAGLPQATIGEVKDCWGRRNRGLFCFGLSGQSSVSHQPVIIQPPASRQSGASRPFHDLPITAQRPAED